MMNDNGENIVRLARELLLHDNAEVRSHEPVSPYITLSFKALCFATILTAFGSSAVTLWASETRRPLTRYERTRLKR